MSTFSTHLIHWQRIHGRHDLPWQGADAYRVWLSEIMLQQTQVVTVLPYYQRFIDSFPDVSSLAAAPIDDVLAHWSGLGYYARGRNLHRAAQHVVAQHGGEFPREFEQLLELSGIGRSTAAAICALAYHQNHAILDGNVKRVLARYCGIHGVATEKSVETQLWQAAIALLPERDIAAYTQALMDMGATLCTRSKPQCERCPVRGECVAHLSGQVAQLPTPRARKTVPEKSANFLLLRCGDQVLLEKRPSSGIWGGLWCPPQIEALAEWMQQRGLSGNPIPLPPFSHTFTHFKLHLTPLILDVDFLLAQPESEWMTLHDALNAAIPTPVRKILLACRAISS
ncbi:MAG: A/G-specific adenine glycosylase [Gallionella sp.]|nr:A/G-specific adenine glycosylase [Gallionella sp.]MDD4959474.1 A/G-specific adenine glycosylase [Gallionella sp.]